MTERINGIVVSSRENPQQCDLCGKIAELRPYGPGGSCICFPCGMKDEKGTEARMGKILFDEPLPEGVDP